MTVRRATERYVLEHPGVRTWSSFSAGSHYDPSNLSYGPVIGCDEHLVDPGAGFDWHVHRGVVIVSRVLTGVLRHEDDREDDREDDGAPAFDLGPDDLLVQSAGDGIRHRETNPSATEPLRFVQTTLLLDLEPYVRRVSTPARIGDVVVDLAAASGLGPGDTRREGRTFTAAARGLEMTVEW